MRAIGIILLFFASMGFAGDVGGNSGHSVYCDGSGPIQGSYLLDYLEGMIGVDEWVPYLGPDSLSVTEKALVAIGRLERLDSKRAGRYAAKVKEFLSQVNKWVVEGPPLDFKNDMGTHQIPANCKLQQLAINLPIHPSIPPFNIDARLYYQLDKTHQAGLLLHEAIYSETLSLGQDNSSNARQFNAWISSGESEFISQADYDRFAAKVFEPQFGPEFKAGILLSNAFVGTEYSMVLKTLLKNASHPNVTWSFIKPIPPWLHYEAEGGLLAGRIPSLDPQDLDIHLVAFDGKKSAIAILRLVIR